MAMPELAGHRAARCAVESSLLPICLHSFLLRGPDPFLHTEPYEDFWFCDERHDQQLLRGEILS